MLPDVKNAILMQNSGNNYGMILVKGADFVKQKNQIKNLSSYL